MVVKSLVWLRYSHRTITTVNVTKVWNWFVALYFPMSSYNCNFHRIAGFSPFLGIDFYSLSSFPTVSNFFRSDFDRKVPTLPSEVGKIKKNQAVNKFLMPSFQFLMKQSCQCMLNIVQCYTQSTIHSVARPFICHQNLKLCIFCSMHYIFLFTVLFERNVRKFGLYCFVSCILYNFPIEFAAIIFHFLMVFALDFVPADARIS